MKEKRLHGFMAIAYAEEHDFPLCKYEDPREGWRCDLAVDEAYRVAEHDPQLVYIDVAYEGIPDYCTQNDGECGSCSMVSYGRDCQNEQIS